MLASGAPMAWLWGYTVDDALITARVAAHLFRGLGHRFNATGPVVDAVTPLGFAYLLAPASGGDPLRALHFAKWLGACAGLASAALLGREVARLGGSAARWSVLVPLALSAPLAAWCVSGMETGVVVLLATLALGGMALDAPATPPTPPSSSPAAPSSALRLAPLASGVAAALRPELILWSLALAFGRGVARRDGKGRLVSALALAAGPALLVVLIRLLWFGHPAPLAVWAKPSTFLRGLFYVLAALIWTGAPMLLASPRGLRRLGGESRAVALAVGVHCGALVLVGGDWMALFRLFVPVLPSLFLLGARLASVGSPAHAWARAAAAAALSGKLLVDKSEATRGVLAQRLALIEAARPLLGGEGAGGGPRRVAALDVGWVGAATDAEIVDLAGVTDERVARLPGGHTSKRLPPGFLSRRGVDTLVLLSDGARPPDLRDVRWSRAVEGQVAHEAAGLGFEVVRTLELSGTSQQYLVLRMQDGS